MPYARPPSPFHSAGAANYSPLRCCRCLMGDAVTCAKKRKWRRGGEFIPSTFRWFKAISWMCLMPK